MYQKYHTDAIVLKSYESGESDRVFALYTHDFGLVYARATSIRSEKSKMRYALQTCARAHVSLVKGKNGWRLAGAITLQNPIGKDTKGVGTFARIAELVVRMVGWAQWCRPQCADPHALVNVEWTGQTECAGPWRGFP